jgi:hypothetical protein
MLFREINAAYSEDQTKPIKTEFELLTVKAGAAHIYQSTFKG